MNCSAEVDCTFLHNNVFVIVIPTVLKSIKISYPQTCKLLHTCEIQRYFYLMKVAHSSSLG